MIIRLESLGIAVTAVTVKTEILQDVFIKKKQKLKQSDSFLREDEEEETIRKRTSMQQISSFCQQLQKQNEKKFR